MMYLLLRWLINTLILILVSMLIPGFHLANFWTALIAALVISILNALIRPVLIILTFPINLITLGLFTFFINALMLFLASSIVKGFTIDSYASAFLAGLIIWVINLIINSISHKTQRV